jgi:hypothetical protein
MQDKKSIKITSIPKNELDADGFNSPSKYYIIDALGIAQFIHCRKIEDAVEWINENYGIGKYRPITAKISKGNGNYSASGTNTLKCFSSRLKGTT